MRLVNPQAYKRAIFPPMLQRQADDTDTEMDVPPGFRRFVLRWNSRKVPGKTAHPKDEWQTCQGVQYSDHNAQARISLSTGQQFTTRDEMEDTVRLGGDCEVKFIDE
jgi:hypothetical protein